MHGPGRLTGGFTDPAGVKDKSNEVKVEKK